MEMFSNSNRECCLEKPNEIVKQLCEPLVNKS